MVRSRDPERGAALVLTLVTIAALLGLGAVTVLSMQSELGSSGQSRFQQQALYAAESGVAAAIDYLRGSCHPQELFSASVSEANVDPPRPPQILGNGILPGQAGNPFNAEAGMWYEVELLNNASDSGLAAGDDTDAVVIARVTGHGPDNTVVTVEVEVRGNDCIATFCAQEFAQRNLTSRNDANAVCSVRVEATTTTRTITPGATP
jgi:hypothetical protein